MQEKLQSNVFFKINSLSNRVNELQKQINELNEKLDNSIEIERCHLLRIKNGDQLSDDYILNGRQYNDMTPDIAYEYYQQEDTNFILLDVSEKQFNPIEEIPEATKIPFDQLSNRYKEIVNRAVPILVISENGTSSILACELLNSLGYFNVNNVSGGYKFWKGYNQTKKNSERSA